MTTPAELVAQVPAPDRGVVTSFAYNGGGWRFVLELADPSKGSGVVWHDITAIVDPRPFTGYDLTRGAEAYMGRYRASMATLDLYRQDDKLAPWYPDTSEFFGTHIDLGPGLLLRAGFIRVAGGITAEWNPRFTNKVSSWGDESHSHGKVRQHRVVARDMLTSLVNVPLPARPEENWSDRMYHFLVNSGWPYGSAIYGAQFTWDGQPIKTLPARDEVTSAVNELDAICDPLGLTWYTNRLGQLVVRPRVDDTFHRDAFNAGATGDRWPGDVNPVDFTWYACMPVEGESPSQAAAYAVDFDPVQPFGFDKDEANVQNHVRITIPASGSIPADIFDDDDPISIQRYDRKTYQASWGASNDVVAEQILATRANAVAVARPLHTNTRLTNFFPGPAYLDYLGYVAIQHRNNDEGGDAWGNGWLRYYREQVRPLGCDIDWSMTFNVDLYSVGGSVAQQMRPVENLGLYGVSDWEAEFRWNNPPQVVIPTHTQVRILSGASIWQTIDYPEGFQFFWGGLAPSTPYEFQVRLLRIEDNIITDFSPVRSINFTTLAPFNPYLDMENGNILLPLPGADCEMFWMLEQSSDGTTWTPAAITPNQGTVSSPPFKVPVNIDNLDPAFAYRATSQEYCSGVPQGLRVSKPRYPACRTVARLSTPPFNDPSLIAYIPMACPKFVDEALSMEPVTAGSASDGWDFQGGVPVLWSSPDHGGAIGYGAQTVPSLSPDDPLTILARVNIGTQPDKEYTLFTWGGMWISIVPQVGGFRVRGNVNEEGAGHTFIAGPNVFPLHTLVGISLTHDPATGDLRLYVNGTPEASALGTVGRRWNFGLYDMHLPANSWGTDYAVWDKVLLAPVTVTVNQHPTQTDPTSTSPILFVAEFSEPVTGFGPADVVLTGTAAAGCTVAVGGTGSTYTISVSGMTTAGTITATIPAGVATSASGAVNSASTSTDNTVSWGAPPLQMVFDYTGDVQYWVVPKGLTSVEIELWGAAGAGGGSAPGGKGGYLKATIPVVEFTRYKVIVGGQGGVPTPGWPNGGVGGTANNQGDAGGAASYIILDSLPDAVGITTNADLVAGAGGGGSDNFHNVGPGGDGGYPNGTDAATGTYGKGGTQTAGGVGFENGDTDGQGHGGDGQASGAAAVSEGGGGGGGWHGGGSGVNGIGQGGGGGGSTHWIATATGVVHTTGVRLGHGRIIIHVPAPTSLLNQLLTTGPTSLWYYRNNASATKVDLGSARNDQVLGGTLGSYSFVTAPDGNSYPIFGDTNDHYAMTVSEAYGSAYTTGCTFLMVYRATDDGSGVVQGGSAMYKRKPGVTNGDLDINIFSTGRFGADTRQSANLNSMQCVQKSLMAIGDWVVLEVYYPPATSMPVLYREGLAVPPADRDEFSFGGRGNNGAGLLITGGQAVGGSADAKGPYVLSGVWMRALTAAERADYRAVLLTEGW